LLPGGDPAIQTYPLHSRSQRGTVGKSL